MLSLAKKKELEAQEKPEFLPDDRLRPWVANPAAKEQVRVMVEDLEKMLALGSPVKEEHGASEIDRQIGEVDEDLLQVDDEPEESSDFPLPSEAFRAFLRRQQHRQQQWLSQEGETVPVVEGGGSGGGEGDGADLPISEDREVKQLIHAMQQQRDEEARPHEGHSLQVTSRRPLATHRRLQAIRRERMKAKEELDEKRVRIATTSVRPVSACGSISSSSILQQHRLKPQARVCKKKRPASSSSTRRNQIVAHPELGPFACGAGGEGHVDSEPHHPPPPRASSAASCRSSRRNKKEGVYRGAAWEGSAPPHREARPTSSVSRQEGGGGHSDALLPPPSPPSAAPGIPLSSRRTVVGDMLPAAASDAANAAPSALSPALIDLAMQHQHHQHKQHHHPPRPASSEGHASARRHPQYIRPYADINAPPRPFTSSSCSSSRSGAASDGTIEVYQLTPRDWAAVQDPMTGESRPPGDRKDKDTYKKRSQALKQELIRYETAVLKRVDPRDLRNEMKIKGVHDHVWKVFVDPTISLKGFRDMMVSQTKLDHTFGEHFEHQIRMQRRLFPEFSMKQSKEAAWAENALVNRINVFESGTWPRKPGAR